MAYEVERAHRDELHQLQSTRLRATVENAYENVLSFTPDEFRLVDAGGIERTDVGKVQRVFDRR